MTYIEKKKGAHYHKFFVDRTTMDYVCLCGAVRGQDEKRAKYHNRSTIYNGICYHSGLEARHAAELDLLIRAKQIKSWERQVKLDLKINGMHITNYYIDFIAHHNDGSREFIECKGMELEPWKTKWKILEATFNDFKQHPDDRLTVIKEANSRRFRK
jgi:hypothetical protein